MMGQPPEGMGGLVALGAGWSTTGHPDVRCARMLGGVAAEEACKPDGAGLDVAAVPVHDGGVWKSFVTARECKPGVEATLANTLAG